MPLPMSFLLMIDWLYVSLVSPPHVQTYSSKQTYMAALDRETESYSVVYFTILMPGAKPVYNPAALIVGATVWHQCRDVYKFEEDGGDSGHCSKAR